MGSLFPDLNLFPPTNPPIEQPPQTSSNLLITPKLEPKSEPIETHNPIHNTQSPQTSNPHSYYISFQSGTVLPQHVPTSHISQPVPGFQNVMVLPQLNPNPNSAISSSIPSSQIAQPVHEFQNSTVLPQKNQNFSQSVHVFQNETVLAQKYPNLNLDVSTGPSSQISQPVPDFQSKTSLAQQSENFSQSVSDFRNESVLAQKNPIPNSTYSDVSTRPNPQISQPVPEFQNRTFWAQQNPNLSQSVSRLQNETVLAQQNPNPNSMDSDVSTRPNSQISQRVPEFQNATQSVHAFQNVTGLSQKSPIHNFGADPLVNSDVSTRPNPQFSQPVPEFQNKTFLAKQNENFSQSVREIQNSTVLAEKNSQISESVPEFQNGQNSQNPNSQDYGSDGESHDPDAMALVLVPQQDNQVAVAPFKFPPRSNELVRVSNLSLEDRTYYREYVRKTRMVFDSLRVLADETKRKLGLGMGARGDLRAASEMKVRGLWMFRDKRIVGSIPGIEVGDVFFFRMELCVFGLHGHSQAGIDYLTGSRSSNGEPIATSIVVSGGYEDDEDQGDVLIYTGQGGQDKNVKNKQVVSQQLARGNLGLERSMFYGIEVRVIRGVRYPGTLSGKVYVYDGLYKVTQSWFDEGKSGFGVFKYKLVRVEGQPEMGSAVMRFAANLKINPLSVRPVGYVSLDMALGKEKMPVLFYNDVDKDYSPMYHEYIGTTLFPPYAYQGRHGGCECVSGCTDGCLCVKKNGDEFAYDSNGLLMRGKPLVFECGINCQCPPSCRNRVCQNGIKYRLEVFRSEETQWGVRSLDLIQAGSFICEFAGLALTKEQAQIVAMNGDSLVYPSQFATRWTEWGDLSAVFTDYVTPSYPSVPPLDFALDVSKLRNVACYISHSLSPNVFVQFVLYDHNSLLFPHLMLFAMENIPPMRELSLDYGVADEATTGKLLICN